jgi:hypothetical protein
MERDDYLRHADIVECFDGALGVLLEFRALQANLFPRFQNTSPQSTRWYLQRLMKLL